MENIFHEAKNESAFLKTGLLGFPGSGKTFTAGLIATGLHKYIKSEKPIYFLDTETGSDFIIPIFKKENIKLQVAKSRAFKDLLESVKYAESVADILIIDSITHFWNELLTTFQKDKNVDRLQFQHWMPIKKEWKQYTDLYLTSKLHIIMCGRAGWEYDFQEDGEGGKDLIKTGTKMKAETEMGFEPSLLIEMVLEKVQTLSKKNPVGATYMPRAYVLKDRFDKINGKCFDKPTFESFLPHIELLNLGGEHKPIEDRTSAGTFVNTGESFYAKNQRKKILVEELENEIILLFPGSTVESKTSRLKLCREIFKTDSWTAITEMGELLLSQGLKMIKEIAINSNKIKEKK